MHDYQPKKIISSFTDTAKINHTLNDIEEQDTTDIEGSNPCSAHILNDSNGLKLIAITPDIEIENYIRDIRTTSRHKDVSYSDSDRNFRKRNRSTSSEKNYTNDKSRSKERLHGKKEKSSVESFYDRYEVQNTNHSSNSSQMNDGTKKKMLGESTDKKISMPGETNWLINQRQKANESLERENSFSDIPYIKSKSTERHRRRYSHTDYRNNTHMRQSQCERRSKELKTFNLSCEIKVSQKTTPNSVNDSLDHRRSRLRRTKSKNHDDLRYRSASTHSESKRNEKPLRSSHRSSSRRSIAPIISDHFKSRSKSSSRHSIKKTDNDKNIESRHKYKTRHSTSPSTKRCYESRCRSDSKHRTSSSETAYNEISRTKESMSPNIENHKKSSNKLRSADSRSPSTSFSLSKRSSTLHSSPKHVTNLKDRTRSHDIKSYKYSVIIPKYLMEEHCIRQKIDAKIHEYISNPESHPQHNQEWIKFATSQCQKIASLGANDFNEELKEEWRKTWSRLIQSKYEETFIKERRSLLLQFDIDFADVESYRKQQLLNTEKIVNEIFPVKEDKEVKLPPQSSINKTEKTTPSEKKIAKNVCTSGLENEIVRSPVFNASFQGNQILPDTYKVSSKIDNQAESTQAIDNLGTSQINWNDISSAVQNANAAPSATISTYNHVGPIY